MIPEKSQQKTNFCNIIEQLDVLANAKTDLLKVLNVAKDERYNFPILVLLMLH